MVPRSDPGELIRVAAGRLAWLWLPSMITERTWASSSKLAAVLRSLRVVAAHSGGNR